MRLQTLCVIGGVALCGIVGGPAGALGLALALGTATRGVGNVGGGGEPETGSPISVTPWPNSSGKVLAAITGQQSSTAASTTGGTAGSPTTNGNTKFDSAKKICDKKEGPECVKKMLKASKAHDGGESQAKAYLKDHRVELSDVSGKQRGRWSRIQKQVDASDPSKKCETNNGTALEACIEMVMGHNTADGESGDRKPMCTLKNNCGIHLNIEQRGTNATLPLGGKAPCLGKQNKDGSSGFYRPLCGKEGAPSEVKKSYS